MDPVSLVVEALVAGGTAALKESATDAVKSAYAVLKSLLGRKLDVDALEEEGQPLREQLVAADVGADAEVVEAAGTVLKLVDPAGAQVGRYNVVVSGGQGIVIGEHAQVTQNFGTAP